MQLLNKTENINEDDFSTIKQDPYDNKESLDKQSEKKKSKFNIVNLLFNR